MSAIIRVLVLSLCLSGSCMAQPAPTTAPTTVPTSRAVVPLPAPPKVGHVVIVSVDGLRPDVALRADMPTLRSLLAHGTYTFWASTTDVAITLPSHVSMLTGVNPDRHKIYWNDNRGTPDMITYPTLFDRAHAKGLTTALVATKLKFSIFDRPGVVDHASWPTDDKGKDDVTGTTAAQYIRSYRPQLLFVHFAGADQTGHGVGWGSPEQVAAVERIDKCLGGIVTAIHDAGLADDTAIILSADHGGAGKNHGANDPRSKYIPWIASGPMFNQNLDLTTRFRDRAVRTEDTYATTCWLLGLEPGDGIDGQPVSQIAPAASTELLQQMP
jgi:hypothetical protein